MEISNFNDWWEANSDSIFKNAKTDGLYDTFQRCWEIAASLELQRCASLDAHRLSWEAQVSKASQKGYLREFLDFHRHKLGGPGGCT